MSHIIWVLFVWRRSIPALLGKTKELSENPEILKILWDAWLYCLSSVELIYTSCHQFEIIGCLPIHGNFFSRFIQEEVEVFLFSGWMFTIPKWIPYVMKASSNKSLRAFFNLVILSLAVTFNSRMYRAWVKCVVFGRVMIGETMLIF